MRFGQDLARARWAARRTHAFALARITHLLAEDAVVDADLVLAVGAAAAVRGAAELADELLVVRDDDELQVGARAQLNDLGQRLRKALLVREVKVRRRLVERQDAGRDAVVGGGNGGGGWWPRARWRR